MVVAGTGLLRLRVRRHKRVLQAQDLTSVCVRAPQAQGLASVQARAVRCCEDHQVKIENDPDAVAATVACLYCRTPISVNLNGGFDISAEQYLKWAELVGEPVSFQAHELMRKELSEKKTKLLEAVEARLKEMHKEWQRLAEQEPDEYEWYLHHGYEDDNDTSGDYVDE